jgi:hypothetical protein
MRRLFAARTRLGLFVLALAGAAAVSAVGTSDAKAAAAAPWDGGYSYVSPVEQRMADISTLLTDRSSRAYCNSPEQWAALGMTTNVLAFVPGNYFATASYMQVSPFVCAYTEAFIARPLSDGQKVCPQTQTQYETQRYSVKVRRKIRVGGHMVWRTVRVWHTRSVPIVVSVPTPCEHYMETIISVETIGHEAMHIGGIRNEAVAECFGMQVLPIVANRLGADARFAYEIAADYLPYYASKQTYLPEYWSSECYDGGSLDIWKDKPGWPTPIFGNLATSAVNTSLPIQRSKGKAERLISVLGG